MRRWFIVLFVIFVFLRLPSLFEPYWYGDEGIYLAIGQSIRRGALLYRDIFDNKTPLIYYLAAIAQTVFGFRLLLSVSIVFSLYFFRRLLLAFKINPILPLFLYIFAISLPFIEGNIANAEVFMLLPTIAAVYFFIREKYFFSGLLFGLSFLIKVPVIVEFAFFGLAVLLSSSLKKSIKPTIFYVIGFFIPYFLFFLYFLLSGYGWSFLLYSLLGNFGYLSSWSTGSQTGSGLSSGLAIRTVILLLFWGSVTILHFRRFLDRRGWLLFGWLAAAAYAVFLSGRPYPHYLIQLIPPAIAILFSCCQYGWLTILSFVTLFFSVRHFNFYTYPVFSYYQNFYSHLFSLSSPKYLSYFDNNLPSLYSLSHYLTSIAAKTDRLYLWGDQSFIFPLTALSPASRYIVSYHVVDYQAHRSTIDQLKTNPPPFVVFLSQPSRPFPELLDLLRHYYYLDRQFGPYLLYRLR
jgi:hypothetical protein